MDLKKFDKNQIEPLGVLILLVGAGMVMVFVLLPMMHRADDLRSQVRLMKEEIARVRNFMKTGGSILTADRLITLNEVPSALEEITVLGAKHEITFLSMVRQDKANPVSKKPKTPKTAKTPSAAFSFNTLSVDIETSSTYKQLGLFLGGLNGLHQSIVLIDNLQIARDKREPDKVTSKIQINICLKSDDHGQK